jgi:hypothetical protein
MNYIRGGDDGTAFESVAGSQSKSAVFVDVFKAVQDIQGMDGTVSPHF